MITHGVLITSVTTCFPIIKRNTSPARNAMKSIVWTVELIGIETFLVFKQESSETSILMIKSY